MSSTVLLHGFNPMNQYGSDTIPSM